MRKPKSTDTDEYRSDDLDEAAFIEAQGLRHSAIKRNANGRSIFVFPARERALALARQFTDSESADFARARRALAWKLHRV